MAIIIKTPEQIETLRVGGKRLARILDAVASHVRPGMSAKELDIFAEKLIYDEGDEPAFKNYKPSHHSAPYPASLIVSINSEVVHGIPKENKILKEGDIVSLDLGIKHKGLFTDHAVTIPVGNISKADQELLTVTHNALMAGIESIVPNKTTTGDVGVVIASFAKKAKYGIVRELAGHGVGVYIHEDPFIPNYGKKGNGDVFVPGMVVAIEPMFNRGRDAIVVDKDGYTVRTADGSRSAHFEHTILITETGVEIPTKK